jgi:hypothetical protein
VRSRKFGAVSPGSDPRVSQEEVASAPVDFFSRRGLFSRRSSIGLNSHGPASLLSRHSLARMTPLIRLLFVEPLVDLLPRRLLHLEVTTWVQINKRLEEFHPELTPKV